MAHEIEVVDGKHAFAYNAEGGTPWHRHGTALPDGATPAQMQTAASLGWGLTKVPIQYGFTDRFNHTSMIDGKGKFALIRDTDGKLMDVVGPRYRPVQNVDLFKWFVEFCHAGNMRMETAGSLHDGLKVFVTAKVSQEWELRGGDAMKQYILIASPNYQGESLLIRDVQERVVCANTLGFALSESINRAFRMSHFLDFSSTEIQTRAKQVMGLVLKQDKVFHDQAKLLSETYIKSEAELMTFLKAMGGIKTAKGKDAPIDPTPEQVGVALDEIVAATEGEATLKEGDLNKRGESILEAIMSSPGSDLESAQGTYWGVLNGVTHYVDYTMGKDAELRADSAMFGEGAKLKSKALELVMEMATATR